MAMDPKQERALRDGTASVADEPRDTDIDSVREQAENPPITERSRSRRRTAAVADVRVNQEAGTPVDQMARELGAEPVPEMGRAPRNKTERGTAPETDPADTDEPAPVAPREARRVDERPEDRMPRDLPKSRDDRSAPKGNITAGQDERNPNFETRDDQRPGPPSRAFSLDAARDAAAMPGAAPRPRPIAEAKRAGSTSGQVKDAPGRPEKAEKPKADRTPSMPKPKSRTAAKRTGTRSGAQARTRAASTRGATKRANATRAKTKRAAPKRSAAKRAAPRKRTVARRPAGRAKKKR